MAKDNEEQNGGGAIQRPYKGMCQDTSFQDQPEGTYTYALNACGDTETGDRNFKSNENSNAVFGEFRQGYCLVGDVYIGDGKTALFFAKEDGTGSEIGIHDANALSSAAAYATVVNDESANAANKLGFHPGKKISATFRLRRGCERVLYFTTPTPMAFNLDKPEKFKDGDGMWDLEKFLLFKQVSLIPVFKEVKVENGGQLLPGSYNFAIQLLDADFNPTYWMTVTDTVIIYNDNHLDYNYSAVRGSINLPPGTLQDFGKTSKRITLTIDPETLDDSFPYYRIAVIAANTGSGKISEVLYSEERARTANVFSYDGTNANVKGTIEDVQQFNSNIISAKHIEQLENRLLLANTGGVDISFCELQQYASQIKTEVVFQPVAINNLHGIEGGNLLDNAKRPTKHTERTGYMPGEIYSFGIVYVLEGGIESPVFHIPGNPGVGLPGGYSDNNTFRTMAGNIVSGKTYDASYGNYWDGTPMANLPVRHHRFPLRSEIGKPMITGSSMDLDKAVTTMTFKEIVVFLWLSQLDEDMRNNRGEVRMRFKYYVATTAGISERTYDYAVPFNEIHPWNGRQNFQHEAWVGDPARKTRVIPVNGVVVDKEGIPLAGKSGKMTMVLENEGTPVDERVLCFFGTNKNTSPITIELIQPQNSSGRFYVDSNEARTIVDYDIQTVAANTRDPQKQSEMFGVKFTNIKTPPAIGEKKVVGYYIVSNERNENTKTVLDTGILCPLMEEYSDKLSKGYKFSAHGQLMPNFSSAVSRQFQYAYALIHPEFRCFNHQYTYADELIVEGKFKKTNVTPIVADEYTEDVMTGTTYTGEDPSKPDPDGYDLRTYTRDSRVEFEPLNGSMRFIKRNDAPPQSKLIEIFYLNALSYRTLTYTNITTNAAESTDIYNLSVDNKIGIVVLGKIPIEQYNGELLHVVIRRNLPDAYSEFRTLPYYRDTKFTWMTAAPGAENEPIVVYHGDSYIAGAKYSSAMFYEIRAAHRPPPPKTVWEQVKAWGKAVLGLGLVVLTFFGGGAITATAGAALLLSAWNDFSSGFKADKQIRVYGEMYEAGLADTVKDKDTNDFFGRIDKPDDDEIRWFFDYVTDLYFESRVNLNWRCGFIGGRSDFVDGPTIINITALSRRGATKITYPDGTRRGGRTYSGSAEGEWYQVNPDYMRREREKIHIALPLEYDCASACREKFPLRVHYSEQAFQEELTDNYRTVLPNNYRDIEGETGVITNVFRLHNTLFIHTEEALWMLPQNFQERVTSEIVSFIGTGSYFSVPPRKVVDDSTGMSAGSVNNWATVKTPSGVFFVCYRQRKIYQLNMASTDKGMAPQLKPINGAMDKWFQENIPFIDESVTNKEWIETNRPNVPFGRGFTTVYDPLKERILFSKKEYPLINGVHKDNSWTIAYSLKDEAWESFLSYRPDSYFTTPNNFFSITGSYKIWKHNIKGKYLNFHGLDAPFVMEFVCLSNPILTKVWDGVKFITEARRYDSATQEFVDVRFRTFNKAILYNSRQCSGLLTLKVKDPDAAEYFAQEIGVAPGTILISKNEKDWALNNFRDMRTNYDVPIFDSSLLARQPEYYTDKVLNASSLSFDKDWTQQELFRDKYLVVRLIFDKFEDVKLLINFAIENEAYSNR